MALYFQSFWRGPAGKVATAIAAFETMRPTTEKLQRLRVAERGLTNVFLGVSVPSG